MPCNFKRRRNLSSMSITKRRAGAQEKEWTAWLLLKLSPSFAKGRKAELFYVRR
jgi:hypothetical protein